RGQRRADSLGRAAGRARPLQEARRRDPPRAEGSAQEPASGRRGARVLHQGGEHRADADPRGARRPRRRPAAPPPRRAMNARIALVFVILLAVVGGGALVYNYQERARRPDNVGTLGKPLLTDVKAADIAAVRIVEPKASLTLKRRDDGWVIAERRDFPADLTKVREFVVKLLELRIGQSEPIGDKDRARLALDGSGTVVELNAADGKALGR